MVGVDVGGTYNNTYFRALRQTIAGGCHQRTRKDSSP